jgi:hypothetical protein
MNRKKLGPIHIADNGKRCFVPPCHNLDIVDSCGVVLTTVSSIIQLNGKKITLGDIENMSDLTGFIGFVVEEGAETSFLVEERISAVRGFGQ